MSEDGDNIRSRHCIQRRRTQVRHFLIKMGNTREKAVGAECLGFIDIGKTYGFMFCLGCGEPILTLVQACIAQKGERVILIGDRLVTRNIGTDVPSYEYESHNRKIIIKGMVGIGFAGDVVLIDKFVTELSGKRDYNSIVDSIAKSIKKEDETATERYVRSRTGLSAKQFFERTDAKIPPEYLVDEVYERIEEPVDISALIAGYDRNGNAKLTVAEAEGDVLNFTDLGNVSIGSGSTLSGIYFDQNRYDPSMNENEALLFAFEAKKWAEAHTGVGHSTDIIVIKKRGKAKEILEGSPMMEKMNRIYEQERRDQKEVRRRLIRKMFRE